MVPKYFMMHGVPQKSYTTWNHENISECCIYSYNELYLIKFIEKSLSSTCNIENRGFKLNLFDANIQLLSIHFKENTCNVLAGFRIAYTKKILEHMEQMITNKQGS